MKHLLCLLLLPVFCSAQRFSPKEIQRWEAQARRVNIIRDTWGVPHIYGKTDADAVFGLLYVQGEENFARVERNYLEVLGRQAEVDGESRLVEDLEIRLILDSAAAMRDYQRAPAWFKKLLDAFADGINYYLYTHPETKPKVLQRFEPWYHLMFTDGSVSATRKGGIDTEEVGRFYIKSAMPTTAKTAHASEVDLRGSNGFAIAPSHTASGNAILYINPHVPFYFRTEVQLVSEEGLNAYGAVTWGQLFVYQGFNAYCGWMHTSGYADVADLYEEKVTQQNNQWFYEYEHSMKPVTSKNIVVNYQKDGKQVPVSVKGYYTHHGPVMGSRNGKWLSLKENNRTMDALIQSWVRTKSKGFGDYKKAMEMLANNSNNTVFADNKGNIAYWHGNFVPKRDPSIDWTLPVDGSTAATEWKGPHALHETVHLYNPKNGWIQNCNSTPFTAAGKESPDESKYPAYMAPDGQNPRGLNAMRLLENAKGITLDEIIRIGYDPYLTGFDLLLPSLFQAFATLNHDSLRGMLEEPIALLKAWDRNATLPSIATTLAVDYGTRFSQLMPRARTQEAGTQSVTRFQDLVKNTSDQQKIDALAFVVMDLTKKYGTWKQPWGNINRFQRLKGGGFDDAQPSLPVALTSSRWGSLPAFESRATATTSKRYGSSGNSFVAAVEFGKKVKARTILTGGQSKDPDSPHFTDQAKGFVEGKFKTIFFYKEDVLAHQVRQYRPGQ